MIFSFSILSFFRVYLKFSSQHYLLAMIEKRKKHVDKDKKFGALLTDFFRSFDCLPHDFIIKKLNTCCFSLSVSKLIHNYLSHRKKGLANSSYISWEEILLCIPLGPILGPFLFNIFDLFSVLSDPEFQVTQMITHLMLLRIIYGALLTYWKILALNYLF